ALHALRHRYHFPSHCFHQPTPPALYPLSLHDALPISPILVATIAINPAPSPKTSGFCTYSRRTAAPKLASAVGPRVPTNPLVFRSEEHTSELQSRFDLVCRLLLEKKKM